MTRVLAHVARLIVSRRYRGAYVKAHRAFVAAYEDATDKAFAKL